MCNVDVALYVNTMSMLMWPCRGFQIDACTSSHKGCYIQNQEGLNPRHAWGLVCILYLTKVHVVLLLKTYIYVCIYIYICVCVCMYWYHLVNCIVILLELGGASFIRIQEPHVFVTYSKNSLQTRILLVKSSNACTISVIKNTSGNMYT